MIRPIFVGCVAVGLLVGGRAEAQQFGSEGQFAVSAERMFGVTRTTTTSEDSGVERSVSSTNIGLLWSPLASLYTVPRVGFDFFVIDGLSIGAALGFFTSSGSVEVSGNGQSEESDTDRVNAFLVAPRLGYAYMFNEMVGIWPRAGVTYAGLSRKNPDTDLSGSSNRLALSLEAALAVTPVPHVAFLIGPTLDLGLSGSDEVDTGGGLTIDQDSKTTDFGLQVGLLAYF